MGNRVFPPPAARTVAFVGDTHIGSSPSNRYLTYRQEFVRDLANVPVALTCHIGDLTENGFSAEVAIAQPWWAGFPDPKTQINGDHDLLQSTLSQWETDYGTTEFGAYDLSWIRLIRTNYIWGQTRIDAIAALAAAVAPKPCLIISHRPLRDTALAGSGPHISFTTGTPTFLFGVGAADDTAMRTMMGSNSNIVGIVSGHTHSWIDAPGFATLTTAGARQVAAVNVSAIAYVGNTNDYQTDPLRTIYVTLKSDNKTVEVRYRDHGAGGVWVAPSTAGGRVTTLVTT